MDFAINLNSTGNIAKKLVSEKNAYVVYIRRMEQLREKSSLSGMPGVIFRQNMNAVLKKMEGDKNTLSTMASVLSEVHSIYENFENKIITDSFGEAVVGNKIDRATAAWYSPPSDGEVSLDDFKLIQWKWSDTWKLVSQFGIIGNSVSLFGTWMTGDDWLKSLLNSGKFISKIIGEGASAVKDGNNITTWMQRCTGFNQSLGDLKTKGFWDTFRASLKNQFGKDLDFSSAGKNFTNAEKTANKVKVGSKWAGHIFTLLTNGYENYLEAEKGGISAERAVAETVIETGVDIGIGALATAAVSGAAVAMGFAGAPAVVIGIGAAGVVWAANSVCKWICNDDSMDIGEVAANAICDGVNGVAKKVSDGVQTAWKSVCSWFS